MEDEWKKGEKRYITLFLSLTEQSGRKINNEAVNGA